MSAIKWILRFIGIVLFVIILINTNISSIFNIFQKVNLFYLIIGLLLVVLLIFLKSYRWYLIMKAQGISYSSWDSFLVYSTGVFFGILTPGKIGEFIKIAYLKENNHSFGKSFVSVFLDRIIDLSLLFVIGYTGIVLLFSYFINEFFILTMFIIVSVICFIIFLLKKEWFFRIFRKLIPVKYKNQVSMNYSDFIEGFRNILKNKLGLILFFGVVSWLNYFLICWFFALSLGLEISFFFVALSTSISALITLLPVSILGIGTRDLTLIYLFSIIGLSREGAVAFSLLILTMNLFGGFIGFITWMRKPLKVSVKD